METQVYKRFFLFKRRCVITDEPFRGWGYRILEGPYYITKHYTLGHERYINGDLVEDREGAYRLLQAKRDKERMDMMRALQTKSEPKRKYHPIK